MTILELKIKNKHLSQEAKIIAFEECKLLSQARWLRENQWHEASKGISRSFESLHNHRKINVRDEQRATFIARAYLENRSYASVEGNPRVDTSGNVIFGSRQKQSHFKSNIEKRVVTMINKYGNTKISHRLLADWMNPIAY